MLVIRPEALVSTARRQRPLILSLLLVAAGAIAVVIAVLGPANPVRVGVLACVAAVGIGIGGAWLYRIVRPSHARRRSEALIALLAPTLPDDYTLIVQPWLPVPDVERLDGILVGPGGVRVITVREWHGHYRLHARTWHFETHGRQGWIVCRTNPSTDAVVLANAVARWAADAWLPVPYLRPLIAFPHPHSKVTLEEPTEEVVTTDNAPWWASAYGRVQRLNQPTVARIVGAILDAAEPAPMGFTPVVDRGP